MNLKQANEFRAQLGLQPLVAVDSREQRNRQERNRAAKAQANRDLKARRQGRGK
jgi:hypothetical protein